MTLAGLLVFAGAELSINGQPLAALRAWVRELEELSGAFYPIVHLSCVRSLVLG